MARNRRRGSRMTRDQEKAMFARMAAAMLMANPNVALEVNEERGPNDPPNYWRGASAYIYNKPVSEGGTAIARADLTRSEYSPEEAYVQYFRATGPYSRLRPGHQRLSRKQLMDALAQFAERYPDIERIRGEREYDPDYVPHNIRRKLERDSAAQAHKTQIIDLRRIRARRHKPKKQPRQLLLFREDRYGRNRTQPRFYRRLWDEDMAHLQVQFRDEMRRRRERAQRSR